MQYIVESRKGLFMQNAFKTLVKEEEEEEDLRHHTYDLHGVHDPAEIPRRVTCPHFVLCALELTGAGMWEP